MLRYTRKNLVILTVAMLLIGMATSIFASANSKYSNVIGGKYEVYFTGNDGKLFVTKPKSNDLMQIKNIANVKMAADNRDSMLWVLDKSGEVYCYYEDSEAKYTFSGRKKVGKLQKVKSISIGTEWVYALKSDGSVWGINKDLEISQVKGLCGVSSISIFERCAYALGKDGTVWYWADETRYSGRIPLTKIDGLTNVKKISAGFMWVIALKKDNTVWQWENRGDEPTKPVKINGFTGTKAVEAGRGHGYAIDGKGDVWTWVLDDLTVKPLKVKGVKGAVKIAVSGKYHYVTFEAGRLVVLDKKDKINILNGEYYE